MFIDRFVSLELPASYAVHFENLRQGPMSVLEYSLITYMRHQVTLIVFMSLLYCKNYLYCTQSDVSFLCFVMKKKSYQYLGSIFYLALFLFLHATCLIYVSIVMRFLTHDFPNTLPHSASIFLGYFSDSLAQEQCKIIDYTTFLIQKVALFCNRMKSNILELLCTKINVFIV